MQILDDAGAMLAAGKIELRCMPDLLGSDTCETMIDRFAVLMKKQPEFADIGPCTPLVCRTAVISYRRDDTSRITVIIALKPTSNDPAGAYRIAGIEIAESDDTSA